MPKYPYLSPDVFGCPRIDGYQMIRRQAPRRVEALQGRPRYRLRDPYAAYVFNISYDWTSAQFERFQGFWYGEVNAGADPFRIHLMASTLDRYFTIEEVYNAHATGSFNAELLFNNRWTVNLQVEIPGIIPIPGTLCDVFYAGYIQDPAFDEVIAPPLNELEYDEPDPGEEPEDHDIIGPCPYVSPVSLSEPAVQTPNILAERLAA